MKRKIWLIAVLLVILAGIYILGSGFTRQGSVYISDFSVTDEESMTVKLGVASSAGYVRKVASHQEDGRLYLDCYAAFGGINGSIGAKDEYTVPLSGDIERVAIFRGDGRYEDVLQKDGGVWNRVP